MWVRSCINKTRFGSLNAEAASVKVGTPSLLNIYTDPIVREKPMPTYIFREDSTQALSVKPSYLARVISPCVDPGPGQSLVC